MNLQKILCRLILCEIMLSTILLYVAWFEEQYLPSELRSYLETVESQDLNIQEWLAIGFVITYLMLSIGAWIALWCGSHSGRVLYTSAWIVSIPIYGFSAPHIIGGVQACLEPILGLVSGLIFGLLYFSDLRLTYKKL